MTNGEFIKDLVKKKIDRMSCKDFCEFAFGAEEVVGEYPLLTTTEQLFESEVYSDKSLEEIEALRVIGKYEDDMLVWFGREKKI